MKKLFAFTFILCLVFLTACTPTDPPGKVPDGTKGSVELTLWTYPVGGYGTNATLSPLITAFHNKYGTDIRVSFTPMTYADGDKNIEEAAKEGKLPDLVFEGPERLVANWGARGLMADLSDLWEDEVSDKIVKNVEAACHDRNGKYYIYPLCMTTHCMAINRDIFEKAGALQYIDEETHTWTTEQFVSAVGAIKKYYDEHNITDPVATIYCGGQGGDQGTRALINNLYGGTFTNDDHTEYAACDDENIKALELLKSLDGIVFDKTIEGVDEVNKFVSGKLAMAFCWNVANEVTNTVNGNLEFDVLPMAFPTDDNKIELQGGIWGYGIFDNGDPERIAAAKAFIRFMTQDDSGYAKQAVITSTYWPVRPEMSDIYENNKLMIEYNIFGQYLGDYYQVTPNWANARTAWWHMLQTIAESSGGKEEISAALRKFDSDANGSN